MATTVSMQEFFVNTSGGKRLITMLKNGTITHEKVTDAVRKRTTDQFVTEQEVKACAAKIIDENLRKINSKNAGKVAKSTTRAAATLPTNTRARVPQPNPTAQPAAAVPATSGSIVTTDTEDYQKELDKIVNELNQRVVTLASRGSRSGLSDHFAMTVISIARHLQASSSSSLFLTLFKQMFERIINFVFHQLKCPELGNIRNWQTAFINALKKQTEKVEMVCVPRVNFDSVVTTYNYDAIPDSVLIPTMYQLEFIAMQYAAGQLINSKDKLTKKAFRGLKCCIPPVVAATTASEDEPTIVANQESRAFASATATIPGSLASAAPADNTGRGILTGGGDGGDGGGDNAEGALSEGEETIIEEEEEDILDRFL